MQAVMADHVCVADIIDYLQSQGVQEVQWNLCEPKQPFTEQFDFIFFSEIIEHLPWLGHVVLEG
jgi:hypothetical protein